MCSFSFFYNLGVEPYAVAQNSAHFTHCMAAFLHDAEERASEKASEDYFTCRVRSSYIGGGGSW